MNLHEQAREFYELKPVTDPPVTAWEATFDGGTTWTPGVAAGDGWLRWLVHGPAFVAGDTVPSVLIAARSVQPDIRAVDVPEHLVRDAPAIYLHS